MNVLFANNFYYLRGGSERVFFDEMELLKQGGHQVTPFSRSFEQNQPTEFSCYFPSPLAYQGVSLSQKVGAALKLIYSPEVRHQAGRLMDRVRPDLVHCHNIYGRLTTAVLDAAKQRGIPVVMTLHDYKLVCPAYLMLRNNEVCALCNGRDFRHCVMGRCHKGELFSSLVYAAEAYMSRLLHKYAAVNAFLCPSRFLLDRHRDAGFPESKLNLVPNFIDLDGFTPNFAPGSYVLYAGRLSHEKGVATLLKAAAGLTVPLKIVGDGPLRDELERFALENGLHHVEFLGYRSGLELKRLFSDAAFLVFPSEWYENAPMTILEAFALGKPVLGSNLGGTPELVQEGLTGSIFRAGDVEELRERLAELLRDPERLEQMGRAGRRLVEARHGAENHYRMLMDLYQTAGAKRVAV